MPMSTHPIRRYCTEHGISQKEFAEKVSLSAAFVSQLVNGREVCGRVSALQIIEKTEGEVGLEELLRWKPEIG